MNNVDHVYFGSEVTNVKFLGLRIEANTNTSVGSAGGRAACIWVDLCTNIEVRDCYLTGGSAGFAPYGCVNVSLINCEMTGNTLVGAGGVANYYTIRGCYCHTNGFNSGGFTHEIYIQNSSNCDIVDNIIGNCVDQSYSLYIKNDYEFPEWLGFTECANNLVQGNYFFDDEGLSFSPQTAYQRIDQRGHRGTKVLDNVFDNANLRVANPMNMLVQGNQGDADSRYKVLVSSEEPTYVGSLASSNNTFGYLDIGMVYEITDYTDDFVFVNDTFLAPTEAITVETNFASRRRGTFADCHLPNAEKLTDDLIWSAVASGGIKAYGGSFDQCSNTIQHGNETAFTPRVNLNSNIIESFGLYINSTPVNLPTENVPDGYILRFMVRNTSGSGARTMVFDAGYKLAPNWAATIGNNVSGDRVLLEFIYNQGVFWQLGDPTWIPI